MTNFRVLMLSLLTVISAATLWGAEPQKKVKASVLKHEKSDNLASFKFTLPAPETLPILDRFTAEDEDESALIAADLLELAHSHIGIRYRRGGKTPAGFDCSGFTGYIFRQFGYNLAASSSAQYMQGEKVEKNEVMPGDLLFFNGRTVGSRIGHVGIAIEQDPTTGVITFIHSANGGGIRVDKTSAPYYAKRFVGVRRIL